MPNFMRALAFPSTQEADLLTRAAERAPRVAGRHSIERCSRHAFQECFSHEADYWSVKRVVIVTGGTAGLGRVMVEALLADGHRVVAVGRSGPGELRETA